MSSVSYNLTGLTVVSTVIQNGYTYIKLGPGPLGTYTGTIQFTTPEPFQMNFLLVGGGGSGGGGWQGYLTLGANVFTDFNGGGGGGGGEVVPGQLLVTSSIIFNLNIGQGGIGIYDSINYLSVDGTSTGISESTTGSFFIASGGTSGGTATSGLVYGSSGNGINNSGTGGLGGVVVYNNGSLVFPPIPSTGAINYNPSYNSYNFNGYTIPFPISGGGGGGTSSNDTQTANQGDGSGGTGGYYSGTSLIQPISGTNGAGGGGGSYSGTQLTNTLGANGGDGFIYLSYPNTPNIEKSNFNVVNNSQDLSTIFFPLSLGGFQVPIDTGFKYYDTNSLTYKDISNLYAGHIQGSPYAIQTNFQSVNYASQDLNQIFQNINYIPVPYTVISSSNCFLNFYFGIYNSVEYYGVVINQIGPINIPAGSLGVNGAITLRFLSDISNVNMIIIGGGGGGGGGNSDIGGGGGGGGGVTYITNTSIKVSTNATIQIGCAGAGRNPGYQGGGGNDSGAGGNTSSITYTDISSNIIGYVSTGGGAGLGSGTASGFAGGVGGGTTTGGGNSIFGGGGGGGGGGGTSSGGGSVCVGGAGGTNDSTDPNTKNPGDKGAYNTNSGNPVNIGGDAGSSWLTSVLLPFYNNGTTIYLGGGGGGGGTYTSGATGNGGGAGAGAGGAGNGSISGNGNSANSSLSGTSPGFGGGGGGGGAGGFTAGGGNGGNGVVIIWWNY